MYGIEYGYYLIRLSALLVFDLMNEMKRSATVLLVCLGLVGWSMMMTMIV